jgi:ActR/RegA family two-component response regulator
MEGSSDAASPQADVAEEMAALLAAHRENSQRRLKVLDDAAAALASGALDDELRGQARTEAHKLRGSAGTYGFHRASEIAGELESVFEGDEEIPMERVPGLAAMLLALRTELEGEPEGVETSLDGAPAGPKALIVSDDEEFAAALSSAFGERGVEAVVVGPDAGVEHAQDAALALVDLPNQGSAGRGFSTLAGISGSTDAPLLVLAESGGLLDRVEAARYGARGFLNRSRAAAELVDAALRIATPGAESPATVIAVDDDPSTLAALRALLEPRGYRVETVDDPALFWGRRSSRSMGRSRRRPVRG